MQREGETEGLRKEANSKAMDGVRRQGDSRWLGQLRISAVIVGNRVAAKEGGLSPPPRLSSGNDSGEGTFYYLFGSSFGHNQLSGTEFQGLNDNKFKHIMKELQGAIIIGSAFQAFLGSTGLMSLLVRNFVQTTRQMIKFQTTRQMILQVIVYFYRHFG